MNIDKLVICERCVDELRNEPVKSYIQYRGFYTVVKIPKNNICLKCNGRLSTVNISQDDGITITKISNDTSLLEAMIKLHDNDIIEYNLKLNQFKSQLSQSQITQQESTNQVTCPYCKSTNVKKITGTERVASVIGLGLFSKKINKSFKCNECGGTF